MHFSPISKHQQVAGLHIPGNNLDGTFFTLFPPTDPTIHILMSDFSFRARDPLLPRSFACLLHQVEPAVNYQIKLGGGITLVMVIAEKSVLSWSYS